MSNIEKPYQCTICHKKWAYEQMLKCKYCERIISCPESICKKSSKLVQLCYDMKDDEIFCNNGTCLNFYCDVGREVANKKVIELELINLNEYFDLITKFTKLNKRLESEVDLDKDEYKMKELEHLTMCRQKIIPLLNEKFNSLTVKKLHNNNML